MKDFEELKYIVLSNIKSFLRVSFVVFGLTVTIDNIRLDLKEYLKRATTIELEIEGNTTTAFPSITICLNSMHSKGTQKYNKIIKYFAKSNQIWLTK